MNKQQRQGLSMLEIVFSVGILALIMLPVFMTFSSGNRNIMLTESEFRAHTAALELMEQIVSLPFKQIRSGEYEDGEIVDGGPFAAGPVLFKLSPAEDLWRDLKIEDIKRENKVVFKKVTVTIKFAAAKNSDRIREFFMKTLVANENL
ncbi:MAG: hypothetical protein CVV41_14510 [Candidatus Riflebacteria bacterium HGW-Riflebacteria-1]|jgi:hypothetical protein|nr:MAG: hypothetical protein CVV41_14510 [Candidatus Riflebacteria bacterium HGW-Riflebacteria-1]